MEEAKTAEGENGDSGVQIKISRKALGDLFKFIGRWAWPIAPWLLLGGGIGGGTWFTSHHDSEIQAIKAEQLEQRGELDAIYKIVAKGRAYPHRRSVP